MLMDVWLVGLGWVGWCLGYMGLCLYLYLYLGVSARLTIYVCMIRYGSTVWYR